MHYTVNENSSETRYKYTFDNNTSCAFSLSNVGIIRIETWEIVPVESICSALAEVTNIAIQNGLTPKMHIKNYNKFLSSIAEQCGYRKIPATGISFSIWTRP